MVQRQVLSVIFLALVSTNVIQAGPLFGLFHHETLPNFINLLDIPRLANMATQAFGGIGSYVNTLRTGGLDDSNIPFRFGLLHRLANKEIFPSLTSSAVASETADPAHGILSRIMPSIDHRRLGLFGRHLFGNYGIGNPTGAASAVATSSAAA